MSLNKHIFNALPLRTIDKCSVNRMLVEIKKKLGFLKLKLPMHKKKRIQGFLDGIEGHYVCGWVWDPNNPKRRLEVVIYVDGEFVAEGIADQYREDLEKAGIGDGRHAFRIKLPYKIMDGNFHVIEVLEKSELQVLNGSPKKIRLPEIEMKEFSETKNKIRYELDKFLLEYILENRSIDNFEHTIEGTSDFVIEGKIIDRLDPTKSVKIELWEDSKLLSLGYSDPKNNGKYFIQIPKDVMDGKVHIFTLRTEDGYELGYIIKLLNYIFTPLESLKKYSKFIPIEFTSTHKFRLNAFLNSIETVLGDNQLSSEEKVLRINLLKRAYSIISTGYENLKEFEVIEFPQFTKPKVSIILPVYNNFEMTYICLASIILNTQVPYEVIIVNDGSTDKTFEIDEVIKNIKIIHNEKPQGFLKACNKGASLAEGEYIVILNNDTEVLYGWLKELLWVFENYDKVGLVGAKLLYPNFSLQEAGGIVFGNGDAWNYGRNQNPFDPKYNYIRQVDYCSGACIMLPKWLWEELGGFNEEFAPAYWEDTDLAFRVREKGYKVVYTPFAQVIHYESMSYGKDEKNKQLLIANQSKFRRKWAHVLNMRKNEQKPSADLADLVKDRNIFGRVLTIDYEIPRPDKEAGGYATLQEMRLFSSLGFKVTFIPRNLVYLYGYVEDCQRNGIEVVYTPFYLSVQEFIEKRGKEFDLFYIVRWNVAVEFVDLIRSINPSAKILLNIADLHFLRELREAIVAQNKNLLIKALDTKEKELEVMRKVDLVLSYNEVEHAVILSHNLDSTRIAKWPWVVYPKKVTKSFEDRRNIAFLGNYRHPPNVSAVKFFVEKVMPLLRDEIPGVKFLIYGAHMPQELKDLETEDIKPVGYVRSLDEIFSNCRVFVAPLLYGAGIKGKVIEALSYGVPCVLSPIAAEGTGIRDGLEAFIVEKPEEYVDAIKKLYTDRELWDRMSQHALEFVRKEYSFEKARETVRRALEMVDIYIPENEEGFYVKSWNG